MAHQPKWTGFHQSMIRRNLHIDGEGTTEHDNGPPAQSKSANDRNTLRVLRAVILLSLAAGVFVATHEEEA